MQGASSVSHRYTPPTRFFDVSVAFAIAVGGALEGLAARIIIEEKDAPLPTKLGYGVPIAASVSGALGNRG